MATISNGSSTITPTIKLDANDAYASRNIVHELMGGGVAITFGGLPKRTGTMALYFNNEAASKTAYDFFVNGYVFQLTDTDAPTTDMTFVISGNIGRRWGGTSLNEWILDVSFQEVQP